jgi:hypothetical protein
MNPDLEEMMRSTLPPEETSVSAIIAQHLAEKSQIFKGLTDLRLKVPKRKTYQDFYLHTGRVGIPPRAIGFFKLVVHNPSRPIKYRSDCKASSK